MNHGHTHITSVRTYLVVFAILVVLLVATVGVSFLPLGRFTLVVAMAIAFTKAVLIAIFFMHLRSSNRLTWVFSGAALLWFGILMMLTLNDYLTRTWLDIPSK
jgi:cytochrome c oxidase subunit 4